MEAVGEVDLVDRAIGPRPRIGERVGYSGHREHAPALGDQAAVSKRRTCVKHRDSFNLFGGLDRGARDRIEQAIAAVGLTGFEDRSIATLSGGQMQRMLFARLLLQDARVIVLDEPFNAVDAKTSADLFDLVQRWHGERRTVLTAMHDIDFVRANFPETLLLARQPVAWGRTSTVLTPENLLAARRMCEAFDEHADPCAADEPARVATPALPS